MLFFNKSSVAEVTKFGQVKTDEAQGFIPYIGVVPGMNSKVYNKFFLNAVSSSYDFTYLKSMKTFSLNVHAEKYKIAFKFKPREHVRTLAGIMKIGMVAIGDNKTGKIVTLTLDQNNLGYYNEWKENVLPDVLAIEIKEKGLSVDDFVGYRDKVLEHLENNWMVEND